MYCSKIAIIVEFLSVIILNEFTKVSFRSRPCRRFQKYETHSIEFTNTFCLGGNTFFEKCHIL